MGGRYMNSFNSDRSSDVMEYHDTTIVITERIIEVINISDGSRSSRSSHSSRRSDPKRRSLKSDRKLRRSNEIGDLVVVSLT
jgi:hypothetical protein